MGNTTYVFGGIVDEGAGNYLSSIEALAIRSTEDGEIDSVDPEWRSCQPEQLTPRCGMLVCPIDADNVVIYGGVNGANYLSGGVIWNSATDNIDSLLPQGDLSFCSFNCGR